MKRASQKAYFAKKHDSYGRRLDILQHNEKKFLVLDREPEDMNNGMTDATHIANIHAVNLDEATKLAQKRWKKRRVEIGSDTETLEPSRTINE